jgi:AcrR family transcriptional regulator
MLEDPKGEKVTTAALAARLGVSEAALYRHFASKAQMFEGLIEFIETTVFGLINEISARETSGLRQVRSIIAMLLEFAQTNKGMTRVLIGDALVNENERLQERIQPADQAHRGVAEAELPRGGDRRRAHRRFRLQRARRADRCLCRRPLAPLREKRVPQGAGRGARSATADACDLGFGGRQRPSLTCQHAHR